MRIPALVLLLGIAFMGRAQYPFTRSFEVRIGLQRPHLTSATQGPDGLVWAGSELGLLRTDGVRHEFVFRTEHTEVTAVAADAHHVFAALSSGAIIRCMGGLCDTVLLDTAFMRDPVRAMAVDESGVIWLGTYGAGLRLVRPGPGAEAIPLKGLPDDHVNALCRLSGGRMAVATDQGVSICDAERGALFTVDQQSGAPDNLVMALAIDDRGRLLVGTESSGVFKFTPDEGHPTIELLDDRWDHGPVRALAHTPGAVWVGTESHGTVVLPEMGQGGAYLPENDPDAMPQRVHELFTANDGAVWWCDGSDRLTRGDPDVLFVPHHEDRDLRSITALACGPDGRIWFAEGVHVFAHAAVFVDRERLADIPLPLDARVQIAALHVDDRNAVWVGTMGQGIYRISADGHIDHFTQAQGAVNDNVLAIRSAAGRIWFATLGGICRWSYTGDGGEGVFTAVSAPGSGFMFDVLPLADGGVLAATDGSGVVRVDGSGLASELVSGDGHDTYYSLCMDEAGEVWACGPGTGLCKVREAGLECTGAQGSPFDGEMYGMASYRGRIIAIGRAGMVVLDPSTGRSIDPGDSFGLKGIAMSLNAIGTAPDGSLWLACDRGLVRMRPSDADLSDVIPAMITDLRWGNVVLPLDNGSRLAHDRNFLSFGFSALRTSSPEELRFEYRLAGFDASPKQTRDRQVSYSQLPPGRYRFEVRAGIGDRPMQGDWTGFAFTILAPWWQRPAAVIIGAVLFVAGIILLLRARDQRVRFHERMEKERMRFQLDAVRSQVNPHFLFNSFNTLIELIDQDRKKAVEHVEHLSDFFRNILQVREKDLIPLRDDLLLLDNYFFLEKRRFGESIALEKHIDPLMMDHVIPPLTLQLLVENAIKHNKATLGEPLVVKVEAKDGMLVVSNPLRPKAAPSRSTGFGLQSIRQRFGMVTDHPIEVRDQDGVFEVRIPLSERAR